MERSKQSIQLRLHTDDELTRDPAAADTTLDRLCLGISALSGWRIERSAAPPLGATWSRKLAAKNQGSEWLSVQPGLVGGIPSMVPEGFICDLMSYLFDLVQESRVCQDALAAREAELATAIPVVVDVNADSRKLARRFEAILRNGANAIGCGAAALYLLDDATEHLKLRCQWNLGPMAYPDPPRPLVNATADIEALAGHAIAIEDTRAQLRWQPPHPSGSALCVPVASATTLLGTLWAFGEGPREFTDHETSLWEIVAGSLAAELEREAIVRDKVNAAVATAPFGPINAPPFPSATHGELHNSVWSATTRVHAMELDRTAIVDFREGNDAVVRGIALVAHQDGVIGASQASRTFSQWHQEGGRDEFLSTTHEELVRQSTGDSFVSVASIDLDHGTGRVGLSAAGHVESYLIRPFAWEPWTVATHPLGDATAKKVGQRNSTILHASDWALVVVGALPRTLKVHDTNMIDGRCLAETLLRLNELDIEHAADALWRLLQEHHAAWRKLPSLLLVRRTADCHSKVVYPGRCWIGDEK